MNGLPLYELKHALSGLVDEHRDPLPEITHVQFVCDHLKTGQVIECMELCGGDVDSLNADVATRLKVGRAMLPHLTNLTIEQVDYLHGSDFVALVRMSAPFLTF